MAISLYELSQRISSSMPLGTIVPYYGTDEPSGWKICDGRSCAGSELAKKLGISNVPDLRGRFIRMIGGNAAGMAVAQGDCIGKHKHTLYGRGNYRDNTGTMYAGGAAGGSYNQPTSEIGDVETRPINMAFNYIIKVNTNVILYYVSNIIYKAIAVGKSLLSRTKEEVRRTMAISLNDHEDRIAKLEKPYQHQVKEIKTGEDGYIWFNNGLMIQWWVVPKEINGGWTWVDFPVSFSQKPFSHTGQLVASKANINGYHNNHCIDWARTTNVGAYLYHEGSGRYNFRTQCIDIGLKQYYCFSNNILLYRLTQILFDSSLLGLFSQKVGARTI